ncbi:MAG: nucleotidyltransferase domain-containing protein [Candidatus Cloacimonetes bacterium]|nr:nucleotidyltransferase domain-containing protein [Candidatus Cloacimonadota bacterium]
MLTIKEISEKLTSVFEQNGVSKAILFGSYANGTATKESDIDIVVETEPHIRGYKFVALVRPILDALNIEEMDLISSRSVVPDGPIANEINKSGVVIYERKG